MPSFLRSLQERGCIHDVSHEEELARALDGGGLTFYCGFDPTADSLHVGSMLPLLLMRRLQQQGHKPIVILGSATGMIGDPSGKSEERVLLDMETLAKNTAAIEQQVRLFLSPEGKNGFVVLKNDEWLGKANYLEFLREVGKHFTINAMLAKDSVRARLENREQGISYTEFSYMLLQAYDFYWLNLHHGCALQVGGSDQWGNITAGLELIRRKNAGREVTAYGLTFPLLMTSTGAKFGKTEKGAVWLSPERTSPYEFYQFWLNTADADVMKYIRLFTAIDGAELAELEQSVANEPQSRRAQQRLASELTSLIHGQAETKQAQNAGRILFGGALENVDSKTLLTVFADVPSSEMGAAEFSGGHPLVDLLVKAGLAESKGQARRAIEGGGVYLNNEKIPDVNAKVELSAFVEGKVLVLRSGKKNHHLIRLM